MADMRHPLDVALDLAIEGEPDASEMVLRSLSMDDPRVAFNLGWHELRHGNLLRGMDLMSAGRVLNVFGSPPLNTPAPIFRGPNPIILLRSEGGLGDQICNARFARELSAHGRVVLTAHPALVDLFRTIEGVSDVVPDTVDELPAHDYWVPAMSAAYVLKLEYADLSGAPYLKATPRDLPGNFKIGLRWSGNPQFEHEQHRRFDPDLMIRLTEIPGATYYSFQRDNDLRVGPFTDLRDAMTDWTATAEYLAAMDLLITSDTSVAHCAAALGVKTWLVIPALPYYTWAKPGSITPWYHSVKLYRQNKYGDWGSVFDRVTNDLRAEIHQPHSVRAA